MTCLEARYQSTAARHAFRLWMKDGEVFAFPAGRSYPPMRVDHEEFPFDLVTPRVGRFYPTRPLQLGLPAAMARVTDCGEDTLTFDCNPPWLVLHPELHEIAAADPAQAIGRDSDLLAWLGMETPLASIPTDFAEVEAFTRTDNRPDDEFYREARLVDHLDATCRRRIAALYQDLLPAGGKVLDLLASWNSHVAAGDYELSVLGMNSAELAANPAAQERVTHDLNREGVLPWPDACFDAVISTAAFEYLLEPSAVLAEVRRVLKPGGVLVVSFSNRYFPPKATRLWTLLHPMERLGWALAQFTGAAFGECQTLVECGLQRPPEDRYAARYAAMDPLFAVWGRKPL